MEVVGKKNIGKKIAKWKEISIGILLLLAIIVPYIFKDEIK